MSWPEALLAASLAFSLVFAWLCYRLLVDRGKLLLRIDALEGRLRDAVAGDGSPEERVQAMSLPAGSLAPDFELPDLDGDLRTLSSLRVERLVLVFVEPSCEPCRAMLPRLAETLSQRTAATPSFVVVSKGERKEIARLAATSGLRCPVLVDPEGNVHAAYRVAATPSAHTVGPDGVVEGPLTVGGDAILELAAAVAAQPGGGAPPRMRPLSESRINRSGLPPGTRAPAFELPLVTGGALALDDVSGRHLLLVFSDPDCGPCEELAPRLERLHRESNDLAVVVISRGDRDLNRRKVLEHGITYPVCLQSHWSTSRDYGIFATPVGYLIDGRGVIAAPVAIGVEPILDLVHQVNTTGAAVAS